MVFGLMEATFPYLQLSKFLSEKHKNEEDLNRLP